MQKRLAEASTATFSHRSEIDEHLACQNRAAPVGRHLVHGRVARQERPQRSIPRGFGIAMSELRIQCCAQHLTDRICGFILEERKRDAAGKADLEWWARSDSNPDLLRVKNGNLFQQFPALTPFFSISNEDDRWQTARDLKWELLRAVDLLKYEWLPLEERDFTVRYEKSFANGVSIEAETFFLQTTP